MQSYGQFWLNPWSRLVGAAVLTLGINVQLALWADPVFGWLGAVILTLVLTCLMLSYALFQCKNQKRTAFIIVAAYVVASGSLLGFWDGVRETARWAILSPAFKADVAARATHNATALRHYELDSWGFAGVGDTFVYAMYDTTDSLVPTHVKGAAHIPQIGCDVVSIERKERSWFAVMFYTMTTWDYCR